jgi:hypothetical protein
MAFLTHKNTEKEVRMKKFIVVAIAVLLAIPAISFAGSATSRWDLSLGGYVEFDMGWADKGVNADYALAPRDSYGVYESRAAEYDSQYAAGAAGRLWWIVKGPDAWGGKTSAYVEGDFRGQTNDYGEFNLRHAFMKIDFANDSFQIGRQWQRWGAHFPFGGYLLAFSGLGPSLKGQRNEAIVWDHRFTKEWAMYLGVYHNSNQDFGARTLDDFSQSPYPFFEYGFKYTTDSCGRIGNQIMMFDLGGFLGWERKIVDTDPAQDISLLDDDLNQAWGVALKYYIPIIPERKGNKAGAFGIGGNAFVGQNLGWYGGVGSYPRPDNSPNSQNLSYPHSWGGWFQMDYWFTDKLSFHGWYSHAQNKYSGRFLDPASFTTNQNVMKKNQQYIFNVSYDVNAAMRFGLEYAHIRTHYGNYSFTEFTPATDPRTFYISGDKKGTLNTVRIGAWYFF